MPRPKKQQIEIRKIGVKISGKGSESYFITIPKNIVEEFGWRKGQKIVVKKDGNKKKLVVEDWKR